MNYDITMTLDGGCIRAQIKACLATGNPHRSVGGEDGNADIAQRLGFGAQGFLSLGLLFFYAAKAKNQRAQNVG